MASHGARDLAAARIRAVVINALLPDVRNQASRAHDAHAEKSLGELVWNNKHVRVDREFIRCVRIEREAQRLCGSVQLFRNLPVGNLEGYHVPSNHVGSDPHGLSPRGPSDNGFGAQVQDEVMDPVPIDE